MSYNRSHLIHPLSIANFSTNSACFLITCILFIPFFVVIRRYKRAVEMVSNLPGLRLVVSPMSSLGLVLPRLPMPLYTYPGFAFPSVLKHEGLFKLFKCDTVSLCSILDGRAIIYTCDVPFLTRMASHTGSTVFPKPIEEYGVLSYFGDNVVIAERANWRRQRRVTAPAFCSKMFERLWTDMADITREMMRQENWEERTDGFVSSCNAQFTPQGGYIPAQGEIYFSNVVDVTLRMALAAIARTGFGTDFEWRSGESFTNTCENFGDSFYSWAFQPFLNLAHSAFHLILPPAIRNYLRLSMDDSFNDPATLSMTQNKSNSFSIKLRAMMLMVFRGSTERPRRVMRLQEALHLVAKESTLKLAMVSLPVWVSKLPFRRLRRMNMAFDHLQNELRLLVTQRRHELTASSNIANEALCSRFGEFRGPDYLQTSSGRLSNDNFDLLSNLVRSALQSERAGGSTLSEEEIIGNAYIYLLAGHETTAHSLAWTLALLAAYPDKQEKAYQEIMESDPGEDTTIRDYSKFRFLLACYHETLRLFPPVQQIPKIAEEDTQIVIERTNELDESELENPSNFVAELPRAPTAPELRRINKELFAGHRKRFSLPAIKFALTPNRLDVNFGVPSLPVTPTCSEEENLGTICESSMHAKPNCARSEFIGPMPFAQISRDGFPLDTPTPFVGPEQTRIVVKKGTIIFISPPGVHYNPKYWKDPHKFDPERFMKPYCRAAFIPFGVGSRACLGRKFSEVEAVSMLVHLLRNYSVHLPIRPGETVEDVRKQFSKATVRITLTPEKIPLIFRKRRH